MSDRNRAQHTPQADSDGVIEGRNAVIEALRTGTTIDKIYILKGETDASLGHIASTARSRGIVVVDADRRKLDRMSVTHAHQGVIALCAVREYASVDDILSGDRGGILGGHTVHLALGAEFRQDLVDIKLGGVHLGQVAQALQQVSCVLFHRQSSCPGYGKIRPSSAGRPRRAG